MSFNNVIPLDTKYHNMASANKWCKIFSQN